jgi:hypothetical protein
VSSCFSSCSLHLPYLVHLNGRCAVHGLMNHLYLNYPRREYCFVKKTIFGSVPMTAICPGSSGVISQRSTTEKRHFFVDPVRMEKASKLSKTLYRSIWRATVDSLISGKACGWCMCILLMEIVTANGEIWIKTILIIQIFSPCLCAKWRCTNVWPFWKRWFGV